MPKNAEYVCRCGNIYKYMSGLCRHKKKCKQENEEEHSNDHSSFHFITPELVMELIKDNKDMKHNISKCITIDKIPAQCSSQPNSPTCSSRETTTNDY